jgi:YbbR domain-containing protein
VVSKNISLLPVIKGEPVNGFIIDDIVLEPKQVEVRGPSSVVEPVDILWTEPVDVTKMSESVELLTAPNLPDPALKLVKPVQIKVNLRISEKIVTRIFENVPVQPMQPGTELLDFSLEPEKVSLTLRASYVVMSKLPMDGGVNVRVPLAGLAPGKHERLPIITLPEKVEMVKVEPRVVQIVIHGEIVGTEE